MIFVCALIVFALFRYPDLHPRPRSGVVAVNGESGGSDFAKFDRFLQFFGHFLGIFDSAVFAPPCTMLEIGPTPPKNLI